MLYCLEYGRVQNKSIDSLNLRRESSERTILCFRVETATHEKKHA